ncbi:hypothetical protein [Sediminibacter sp. Hel_I_10]|uniref:hypothetical protein n=1 Tax=Sediminibacter sp. Hel_I_10 TaxID=1392490 RepID=UPI00047D4C31|nr:hypothetical protein [Sediminibacter sp. Hel_I_10]
MIIDKNENTVIITQEKLGLIDFVKRIESSYDTFKNNNIIVNINTLKQADVASIVEFLQLSNNHRGANHSFVVVSDSADLDKMPDEIIVVPTVKEAYDVIEMEDMERDLGF